MKNLFPVTIILFFAILLFTGCRTTRRTSSPSGALKNIVRKNDSRISELNFQVKQLAESNNQTIRKLNELTRQNTTLKQQIAVLKNSIATLGKAINAEKNNRHA